MRRRAPRHHPTPAGWPCTASTCINECVLVQGRLQAHAKCNAREIPWWVAKIALVPHAPMQAQAGCCTHQYSAPRFPMYSSVARCSRSIDSQPSGSSFPSRHSAPLADGSSAREDGMLRMGMGRRAPRGAALRLRAASASTRASSSAVVGDICCDICCVGSPPPLPGVALGRLSARRRATGCDAGMAARGA
jgi:hypothetical protein